MSDRIGECARLMTYVSIDLSFVSAFLCEPNSVIKFSQTGIWKWRRKRYLILALDISVRHLLSIQARYVYRIVVRIPVYLEVAASKLCMIYIVGGNYCKLIIKVRGAKHMWIFQKNTSLLQNGGHFHLKSSPKYVILSFIIWILEPTVRIFLKFFIMLRY